MRVKATRLGFYDLKRRREGEVFILHDPKLFSKKWMKKVGNKKVVDLDDEDDQSDEVDEKASLDDDVI